MSRSHLSGRRRGGWFKLRLSVVERTTPSAPSKEASHLFLMSRPPLLCQGGEFRFFYIRQLSNPIHLSRILLRFREVISRAETRDTLASLKFQSFVDWHVRCINGGRIRRISTMKNITRNRRNCFCFTTAAMAQVEQPSQISLQGTALITKDSNADLFSHRCDTIGRTAGWLFVSIQQLGGRRRQLRIHAQHAKLFCIGWTVVDTVGHA